MTGGKTTSSFKAAGKSFMTHKGPQMAAALSFISIFSLGPILIIAVSIAGIVWGERAVRGEIVEQVEEYVDEDAAEMIQTVLANAADVGQGTSGLIVGIVTLVLGATVVLVQLKDSLNTLWRIKPKEGRPIKKVLYDRAMAFAMVLVIAALLIASLIAGSFVSSAGHWMKDELPLPPMTLQIIELALSALVITLLFAMVFRYLPDARIGWGSALLGGLMTAILFVIGKFILGFYLGRAGVASTYGAAGGLIVLLLWVYYSAIIFLYGAAFTHAWSRKQGERIEPNELAVAIEE